MAKILPLVLKTLRERKGLTQGELAERAKVDKQTIHRLEADDNEQSATRPHTLNGIADALKTDPAVLTGQRPLPDAQDDDNPLAQMSKINFRVTTMALNAMQLMSYRYRVPQADIVELAPFLFCWAAEASLRRRKDRVESAERMLGVMKSEDRAMEHLEPTDFGELEEKIEQEKSGIDIQDLWGYSTDYARSGPRRSQTDPFTAFLEGLADEIGGATTFDEFGEGEYPSYTLFPQDTSEFVGGDPELADAIARGHIPLHQMPKEFYKPYHGEEKLNERIKWARDKLEEYKEALRRLAKDQ